MRKFWLLTALLLLCSAWVVAQSTPPAASSDSSQASIPQTSASSSQGSDTESTKTIEGCLSGSAGSWTLTDSSGKTYQLQGDDSKLSKDVGHQVRIKGSEMAGSSGATPPSSPGGASAAIQFKVKNVEKIADTCPTK